MATAASFLSAEKAEKENDKTVKIAMFFMKFSPDLNAISVAGKILKEMCGLINKNIAKEELKVSNLTTKIMEVFVLKKLTFLGVLLTISSAHAYHYGMAGCGIGGLVFNDQPGGIQIVASTLNNLISPQTSAISSGTSGCYDVGASTAQVNYIETNKVSLKSDIARGNGETLDGLMTMLGCKETQSVKMDIKNNYKTIFNTENTAEILKAIKKNESVQKSCSTLG